jgi:tetratricopeptide (TPR) repeat protein
LLGDLSRISGDLARARSLQHDALATRRDFGSDQGVALSLGFLGRIERAEGNYETAYEYFIESMALWREQGYRPGIAQALLSLADVATIIGDDDALGWLDEAATIGSETADPRVIAEAELGVARLAWHDGRPEADEMAAACLVQAEELGDPHVMAKAHELLGLVHCRRGDAIVARTHFDKSLDAWRRIGDLGEAERLGNLVQRLLSDS